MSWMNHLRMAAPQAPTNLLKGFASVCLFLWLCFSVYRCLSRTSSLHWQAKLNALQMGVCSSPIDILYWKIENYLLMKVKCGNLVILKEWRLIRYVIYKQFVIGKDSVHVLKMLISKWRKTSFLILSSGMHTSDTLVINLVINSRKIPGGRDWEGAWIEAFPTKSGWNREAACLSVSHTW